MFNIIHVLETVLALWLFNLSWSLVLYIQEIYEEEDEDDGIS